MIVVVELWALISFSSFSETEDHHIIYRIYRIYSQLFWVCTVKLQVTSNLPSTNSVERIYRISIRKNCINLFDTEHFLHTAGYIFAPSYSFTVIISTTMPRIEVDSMLILTNKFSH